MTSFSPQSIQKPSYQALYISLGGAIIVLSVLSFFIFSRQGPSLSTEGTVGIETNNFLRDRTLDQLPRTKSFSGLGGDSLVETKRKVAELSPEEITAQYNQAQEIAHKPISIRSIIGVGTSETTGIAPEKEATIPYTYPKTKIVSETSNGDGEEITLENIWSKVPNLISPLFSPIKEYSKDQQAIIEYGNTIADVIMARSIKAQNHPRLADQFFKNRDNVTSKNMTEIADDIESIAIGLQKVTPVPSAMKPIHQALIKDYQSLSDHQRLFSTLRTDSDIVEAIGLFNIASDTFGRDFVALVGLFSVAGVHFGDSDSGSIFEFQPSTL
jgi:hypothetical protein